MSQIRTTAVALLCAAVTTPLFAAGSRGGAAQPPLHAADFSVFAKDDALGLFLLVGQSNMKGRGLIEPKPVTNKRNLFFHHRDQKWYVIRDPLHSAGTPDLIDGSDNAGTGPGMSFAMALLKKKPNLAIGLIPAAVGGASINAYKDKLYDRSLTLLENGRQKSELKTEIRGVLWLQGESDSTEGGYTSYEAKLLDLVDRYRKELKNPELPFIACTIGSFIHPHKRFTRSREINEILLRLPSKRKHTACVDARDLKVTTGDKLHYGKAAQIEIGKRFAAAYLKLVDTKRRAAESPTVRQEVERPSKPNIVFLLSDDQPLRAMGHVDPYFHTPNIDKLAGQGVVFENGFVESSICCVSRASIMMGQHNATHGIQSFDDPLSAEQIQKSFPVLLRKAGYRTALLGKYGIGHTRAAAKELCLPAEHFDLWYGFQQGPSYWQMEEGKKRYLTSVMEEKAIRFMKETPADQPFMVYMCLPEPHGQGGPGGPWNYRDPDFEIPAPNGPPPPVETMTEAAYARLPEAIRSSKNNKIVGRPAETYTKYMTTVRDYTARTDLTLGRIRVALKEMGREDNTVIIFASDNGSMWGAHGIAGKWNMYEESIRVPMMIYDPRLPKSVNGTRSQMALAYDLTATVMDLAGVPAPHMQGKSVLPVMKDPNAEWREDWYYHHDVFSRSKGRPLPRCEGVRGERWKYTRYKKTSPVQEELFDLAADPKETSNLAGSPEHAGILNQLRARNEELKAELAKAAGKK